MCFSLSLSLSVYLLICLLLFFPQNLDFPCYLATYLKHCHFGGQWTAAWLHGSHHSSSSPSTTHTSARGCLRIGPKIWMKPATYSPAEEMWMIWALLPISGQPNKIIHLHQNLDGQIVSLCGRNKSPIHLGPIGCKISNRRYKKQGPFLLFRVFSACVFYLEMDSFQLISGGHSSKFLSSPNFASTSCIWKISQMVPSGCRRGKLRRCTTALLSVVKEWSSVTSASDPKNGRIPRIEGRNSDGYGWKSPIKGWMID